MPVASGRIGGEQTDGELVIVSGAGWTTDVWP
jgi:hypothetical protein